MKKTGGKAKFNPVTKEWEGEPVRYVEFHCTPDEWQKLGAGRQYLVRDWVRHGSGCLWWDPEEHYNAERLATEAVQEIVSERYTVTIKECTVIGENQKPTGKYAWRVYLKEGVVPFMIFDTPQYADDCLRDDERRVMSLIYNIICGVFNLIEIYKRYPKHVVDWPVKNWWTEVREDF